MRKNGLYSILLINPFTLFKLLILPTLLATYQLFRIYSSKIVEGDLATIYLDAQNGWLKPLFSQSVVDVFGTVKTIALWLLLILVGFSVVWTISLLLVSIDDHYKNQKIFNLKVPKSTWHSHFVVILLVKAGLILSAVTSLVLLVFVAIPTYESTISALTNELSWQAALGGVAVVFLLMILQYVVFACIKLYRHTQLD